MSGQERSRPASRERCWPCTIFRVSSSDQGSTSHVETHPTRAVAEAQDLLRQLGVDFDVHSGLDATSALLNWEMRGGRHPAGPTLVEERALVRERAPRPEPAHELLERVEELRRLEARQQQQPGQQGQAQQQQQADDDAREGEAEQDDGHEHENVEAQAGEAEQEDGNERDGEMVMEE